MAQNSHATYERFLSAAKRGLRGALVTHLVFIAMFYAIGAPLLSLINIGSVALYAYCLWRLKRGHLGGIAVLAWFEVIGHAVLAVRVLGWDSGFQYFLPVLLPLTFVNAYRRLSIKLLMAILLCLVFVGLDAWMRTVAPLVAVSVGTLSVLRYANIVGSLMLLGFLSNFYMSTVSQAEEQLRAMAATDMLTGLSNRRRILEIAEYELSRNRRAGNSMSVILCDIDHFKRVNDSFGHETGDRVLVEIAAALRKEIRAQDSIARWGGEEFLVLLPDTGLETAAIIADRLRLAVAATRVELPNQQLAVTMTFGVSEWLRDEPTIDLSIARADKALYQGKRSGRNRTEILPPSRLA